MEVGQICIKTKGREAGRKVIVLTTPKEGRVLIDGKRVKRRECNMLHLFPTNEKIKIANSAPHDAVVKALKN
ncbi:MAG TPA: 50S ribosomal protein L14e [archaeon]|nr:50S ribosomal protein L14e [archaeon]